MTSLLILYLISNPLADLGCFFKIIYLKHVFDKLSFSLTLRAIIVPTWPLLPIFLLRLFFTLQSNHIKPYLALSSTDVFSPVYEDQSCHVPCSIIGDL